MYRCDKCGMEVETLRTHNEGRPYGEGGAYETMTDWNCWCGGEFEEVEEDEEEYEDEE